MSLINVKEIELLKKWASDCVYKNIFNEHFLDSRSKVSYFVDGGADENYIMEYDFHNIAELERIFEKYWSSNIDASARKIAAVSALKLGSERLAVENSSLKKESDEKNSNIPEHIYVF